MQDPTVSTPGSGRKDAHRGRTQKQVGVRLKGSTVELALNPVQCFESLEASLCVFGELLHRNQLLKRRQTEGQVTPASQLYACGAKPFGLEAK